MSGIPSAADNMVKITFANRQTGERWEETGCVGQTLLELAQNKRIGMRGAGSHGLNEHSHVIVGREWEEKIPLTADQMFVLEDIPESERATGSRLACQITLTKDLDGMNVAVPLPR